MIKKSILGLFGKHQLVLITILYLTFIGSAIVHHSYVLNYEKTEQQLRRIIANQDSTICILEKIVAVKDSTIALQEKIQNLKAVPIAMNKNTE